MMDLVYLDNNATTQVAPEVLEAMLPFFRERFGNPSSGHVLGHLSEGALVQARDQVAGLLNCQPAELVFNAGGTEGSTMPFVGCSRPFLPSGTSSPQPWSTVLCSPWWTGSAAMVRR